MNTANIKKYAPKARTDFQLAVIARANKLGIYAAHIEPLSVVGDVMQIGDKQFPVSQKSQRDALERQVIQDGFEAVIDLAASTWFNRLCAIRFMELKEYLDHGYRVLSHPEQTNGFQILEHAADIAEELGLNRSEVLALTLEGDKEEELYRILLLAQCQSLHDSMDFLFDRVDDVSALLLPDGLTRTDSILRPLIEDVPEEDWSQVEIIGWLYQFYISEKKDEVIGKVVKSEDIPAATQLFTPNWIVQYLVQNSVGRQWLQTYPDSSIKADMPYYIEPAEQSDEVNAQLAEITPSTLEPESIKVLDPACGSGHILVEAYNTLKAIYDERGYKARDIPKLILENNLYGLDIDDRAAQLAGFALMMMAREDDRRIFTRGVKLNVLSLQETNHLDMLKLWHDLDLAGGWSQGTSPDLFGSGQTNLDDPQANEQYRLLLDIQARFQQAKTLGSLIEVPDEKQPALNALLGTLEQKSEVGDTAQRPAAQILIPFVRQAWILSQRYDSVVANPPYMGGKYQEPVVKKYLKDNFRNYEKDLFSAFIIRNLQLAKKFGHLGFMTPFVWMFIKSYEDLRGKLISEDIITSLIQLEYSGFDGATVPICTFTITKGHIASYTSTYIRLSDFRGAENQGPKALEAIQDRDSSWIYDVKPDDFKVIPGAPISYWIDNRLRTVFESFDSLGSAGEARVGLQTNDNDRFLRYWHEIPYTKMFIASTHETAKWFPYQKGGSYRKWYGNLEYVVNWERDGEEVTSLATRIYGSPSRTVRSKSHYFREGLTWSTISSGDFSVRYNPEGFIFDIKGSVFFPTDANESNTYLGLLNSKVVSELMKVMSPTLDFTTGVIEKMPVLKSSDVEIDQLVDDLVSISKFDWNFYERSWLFSKSPLLENKQISMQSSFESLQLVISDLVDSTIEKEESINSQLIEAWNLDGIFDSTVKRERITLTINPDFQYANDSEANTRLLKLRCDTIREFVSYSIGCILGRYSLDREGLVYAHAGNEGFIELENKGAYRTFPADDDGIIPLTDLEWFSDDTTYRFRDFVSTVWGDEHLQENLAFVAESLCLHALKPKRGESSLETIRRYLSMQFYKDHLKTYKKRPIYWLFSSGKQKAFECLVYLHRYNEGTLSRMRTEYVTPLIGKYEARLSQLEQQLDSASTSEKTKLKKEISALEKKQSELRTFDDKLKHRADMRIDLDLDDGVKVNYGKFGDLLADVKSVHGKAVK
ncbi:BREX-1 system adenine-specific DNA-methyltransferase PglX [Vibrio splendidus]|uniref:BREX-1 system adenine-specific DNA-methyltransferase PglX n=1 Tax=Vibrio splendidus TaxID=29497 RepID=UPI0006C9F52F|nr:BREX-1 system adenine-specific DNA-methyltransferase PglX [Vibrio splendidus]KPM01484.1 type II restriction endonuclease [Vibrio splendidus]